MAAFEGLTSTAQTAAHATFDGRAMARLSTPEELLHKAMNARSSSERARHARKGLATKSAIDRETHAMLLRQLYLSHFEARRFAKALDVAEQALELDVLPDVMHQDAARAALAGGDLESSL